MRRDRGRAARPRRRGRREQEGRGQAPPLRIAALVAVLAVDRLELRAATRARRWSLYSPHGRDLLELFEKTYEAAHPEVDVRWLDMGSQEVYDRVRSEKANPQADVWFGGPDTIFARGAAEGLLAAYRPSWADGVAGGQPRPGRPLLRPLPDAAGAGLQLRSGAGRARRRATGTTCSPRAWTGKVLIRDPARLGRRCARSSAWSWRGRSRETGCPERGFAWLRAARRPDQGVRRRTRPCCTEAHAPRGADTIWELTDMLLERSAGVPFGYRFAASGTPVIDDADRPRRGRAAPRRGGARSSSGSAPRGAAARGRERPSGCRRAPTCRAAELPDWARRCWRR